MAIDYSFIQKRIQSLPQAFVIISPVTRHPFVVCDPETYDDRMLVFAGLEEARSMVKEITSSGYRAEAATVTKSKLPMALGEGFPLGINQVAFYENGVCMPIELDALIKPPADIDPANKNRPLMNPQLQLSSLYFMQELSRNTDPKKKEALFKPLEEELAANIAKAGFLIPIQLKEGVQQGTPLKPENFQITLIKVNEDKLYFPIFCDAREFQSFNKDKKLKAITLTLRQLRPMITQDHAGAILNPAGIALRLTPQMLDGMLRRFEE